MSGICEEARFITCPSTDECWNRMRNRRIVLLSVILASLILAYPQLSQESYVDSIVNPSGLRWGLEEGDTIGYTWRSDYPDIEPESFHLYMTIDFLPVIQDNISETYQVVLTEQFFTMRFDNGTELEPSISYPLAAFPVGNWTLLQQTVDPFFFGYGHPLSQISWIDTADEWGFKLTYTWDIYRAEVVFRFSRVDGALNVFRGESLDENLQVGYLEITRDGLGLPENVIVILIGGEIAAVIVLSILAARRRR